MGGLDVNAVPIVGQPIAYGIGFVVLVIIGLSRLVARYFLTYAHEGGHVLATFVTLRRFDGFVINDAGGGATKLRPLRWRISTPIIFFFGYPAPSIFGLVAAALIANGNPAAVLLITFVTAVLLLLVSANALATVISALVVVGSAWAFLSGDQTLQATVALAVAWFLLLSNFIDMFLIRLSATVDAQALARQTLIPAQVWALSWFTINLIALIVGAQLLLRPGYGV